MIDLRTVRGFALVPVSAMFGALTALAAADEPPRIAAARVDSRGFRIHDVESSFQAGVTQIRVLEPTIVEESRKKLPVVYVLPVEAGVENRYGDGLLEIQKLGLHNRWNALFVAPTFAQLPWYADHPTRSDVRQESYFVQVVVPFIDRTYRVETERSGRLLLGFSKSGWGAWSLLLRHPNQFGKAAAWDAPLMMDQPGKYGSGEIFGTADNFARYRIARLLNESPPALRTEKRLILHGYGNFRTEHEQVHALMEKANIAHEYRDGPSRKHDWHSGWVADAVDSLLASP